MTIAALARPAGLALAIAMLIAETPARAANYAPLDCGKAASAAETAICRDYDLGGSVATILTKDARGWWGGL